MKRLISPWLAAPILAWTAIFSGCGGEDFSAAEKATIASLSLAALPPLPADPTNKYADDPAAAAFGATLFFDQRMSRDGNVACGTCHLIDRQFQDDLPRGQGRRHEQPAHHAARRRRLEPVPVLGRPARQPVGAGADAARRSGGACRHARRLCAFRRREFFRALPADFRASARSFNGAASKPGRAARLPNRLPGRH